MSRSFRHGLSHLAAALLLAHLAFAPVSADGARSRDRFPRDDQDAARAGVRNGTLVPLSEVIKRIRARYPGTLLDASLLELRPGAPAYRVLWLTPDGRKLVIWVDARTGSITRVEG